MKRQSRDVVEGHPANLEAFRVSDLRLEWRDDVCDDGHGMPDAVQSQVFDAFFTTKAPGEGSGLGLDSARRIVERRHHGRLSFTTGEDGTTFEVRLPLVQQLA